MKKKCILWTVMSLCAAFIACGIVLFPGETTSAAEGDVEINETNFPDEKFRNWLDRFVLADDGVLSVDEAKQFTSMKISLKGITSLKGIEYFTELETLDCSSNNIKQLDLSRNKALKELNCSGNRLTELDLSNNTELTILDCSSNNGMTLDISKNNALVKLDCSGIWSDVDVSEKTALEYLNVSYNKITSLDVSKNKALKKLDCYNNNLTSLDISNNTALETLQCFGNKLSRLDVSKNTALRSLQCGNCNLYELDVTNNTELVSLTCNGNWLQNLDLSKNTKLTGLVIISNGFQELDLSNNTELKTLFCAWNGLTSLDLSKNTKLEKLWCSGNFLESLDVSMNTLLDDLDCDDNEFSEIYVAKEREEFKDLTIDDGVKMIVLTPSDWEYKGTQWVEDLTDPSKTTASALFECTKEGVADYRISEPMTVKVASKVCYCQEEGAVTLKATLPEKYSRTGKAITEEYKVKIPATGHSWGDWKVTKKATVTSEGEETRICKNDSSHKETRKIAKLTPTPTAKAANVSLTLNKNELSIVCGKTASLKAALKGASGKISWKSSDAKVAAVDSNGKITTKMAGSVTITATASGKSAKCMVTVLYKDVTNTKDFWYAPTNYLTAKNVVKGYDKQTKFKPANDCTRAQMVTFLYRLQGEPKTKSATCKFKDVKKTDYFFKPVIWAVENGITTGVSKEKFAPQGVCTRAQTVTFLWRMAKKPAPAAKTCKFKDVKAKDYFYKPVIWASEKKIVEGYKDGTFRPQGKCLRRQMVTFLYKYDKFVNGKG